MQRYFIKEDQFSGDVVTLNGEDAHHLLRVMRARPGDQIIVSDGREREALVEITTIAKDQAEASVVQWLSQDQEASVAVTIAQSLPKGDKLETVIQKGTELGAAAFIPFVSSRTVVQYDARKEAKRLDRWRKIAKEAAEQAHRSKVPEVEDVASWQHIVEIATQYDLALLCYEKTEATQGLRTLLTQARANWLQADSRCQASGQEAQASRPSILLIAGPEGGFTEQEAEQAAGAGIQLAGLGKRILRTETAAMAAIACVMYEFNEMGGTS